MADAAQATGTSSTPAVMPGGVTATAAANATASPPAEPQKSTAASAETSAPAAEPTTAPAAATEPAAAEPAKAEAAPAPLFEIPADLKIAPEAVSKFEAFVKGQLKADGTVALKPQALLDAYLDQARDAHARWEKSLQDLDASNAAACKQRFSAEQLSASETAVGFFSSFDPAFRDFAKRQLNDPTFVNAMRLVGERLGEDTFEQGGRPPPPAKSRAERMGYVKPKSN